MQVHPKGDAQKGCVWYHYGMRTLVHSIGNSSCICIHQGWAPSTLCCVRGCDFVQAPCFRLFMYTYNTSFVFLIYSTLPIFNVKNYLFKTHKWIVICCMLMHVTMYTSNPNITHCSFFIYKILLCEWTFLMSMQLP